MEHKYWLSRASAAEKMALAARSSSARLAHYQMSGLYAAMASGEARAALIGPRA